MLCWSIELGKVYILTEVCFLYQIFGNTEWEDLIYVYHIFRHLKNNTSKNPGTMDYDPIYKPMHRRVLKFNGQYLYEWKDMYLDAQEMILQHMT